MALEEEEDKHETHLTEGALSKGRDSNRFNMMATKASKTEEKAIT